MCVYSIINAFLVEFNIVSDVNHSVHSLLHQEGLSKHIKVAHICYLLADSIRGQRKVAAAVWGDGSSPVVFAGAFECRCRRYVQSKL